MAFRQFPTHSKPTNHIQINLCRKIQTAGVHLTQQGQENSFSIILNYILSPHFLLNYKKHIVSFPINEDKVIKELENGMLPLNLLMIISTTLSVIDYLLVYVTKAIK